MRYRKGDVITVSAVVADDQLHEDSDVEIMLHEESEYLDECKTATVPVGAIQGLRERPIRAGDQVVLHGSRTVHEVIHVHGDSLWVEDQGIINRTACKYHHPPEDLRDPPSRPRSRRGPGSR